MLGLLGGCAGLLVTMGYASVAAAAIAGGMALSVTACVMSVRRAEGDPDGTTEVAALLVVTLGAERNGHRPIAAHYTTAFRAMTSR